MSVEIKLLSLSRSWNLRQNLTFRDKIVNDTHSNTELQELPQMCGEFIEARKDRELLAKISLVERDLLGVGDKTTVHVSIFAFELLLLNR